MPGCNPDALITDAGSTKSAIVERAGAVISRGQFLGGHPMAGRERRGVEAAEADLFRGRPYVLTPRSAAELESPRRGISWIGFAKIGAFPVILDPAGTRPDRGLHLASAAACLHRSGSAAGRPSGAESGVFGPALVDSTRLALSSFDIWGDILATNRRSDPGSAREATSPSWRSFARAWSRGAMRRATLRCARERLPAQFARSLRARMRSDRQAVLQVIL